MNMSYCRFRNTLGDLRDCASALSEMLEGEGEELSRDEMSAAAKLVEEAIDLANLARERLGLEEDEIFDDSSEHAAAFIRAAQKDAEEGSRGREPDES